MHTRTRVKICGVTREADALLAVSLGADAVGLNFWQSGSRYIKPEAAAPISRAIAVFTSRVGIFLDADREEVESVLSRVDLDLIQFHGDEPASFCRSFDLPYIKALRASSMEEIRNGISAYPDAEAVLLDTPADGAFGGAGVTFDWNVIPEMEQRLILAGGLAPDNVGDAITRLSPYAVDVCTGVEATKGIKDDQLMIGFFAAVAAADRSALD